MIHERSRPEGRGRLLTVDTHDDRTLFFDLLPLFFRTDAGFKVKIKLFTVPGQVLHNSTRKVVLQGADGIAFIADSRRKAADENNAYWQDMVKNMEDNGLDAARVPVVIQFNKRDLPDTLTDAELEDARQKGHEAVVGAVAIRGIGVLETLHAVLGKAYLSLDAHAHIGRAVGLTADEFLARVFESMDVRGTQLEGGGS
jgi:mutual gliding-motility protein MglA